MFLILGEYFFLNPDPRYAAEAERRRQSRCLGKMSKSLNGGAQDELRRCDR